jgi:hypothetical protein
MADQNSLLQAFQPQGAQAPDPTPAMPINTEPALPQRGSPGALDYDWTIGTDGYLTPYTGKPPTPEDLSSQRVFQAPLSNGRFLNIPASTAQSLKLTREQANQYVADVESHFYDHYTQQAANTKAPVETANKVYSATNEYSNNILGRIGPHLDFMGQSDSFPGVGNWANPYVHAFNRLKIPFTDISMQDVGETGMRVLPYAIRARGIGPTLAGGDLGATIINAGRKVAGADPQGNMVAPSAALREAVGFPELPANASTTRRIAEAVLSAKPGGSWAGAVPRGVGSYYGGQWGGDLAAAIGGENWRDVGSITGSAVGTTAPSMAKIGAEKVAAPFIRSTEAPDLYARGKALADDARARAVAEGRDPSNIPDTYTPTRSLLNDPWKRITNWVQALPLAGSPLQRDTAAGSQALEDARNASTRSLSGGTFVPGTGTAGNIGALATDAARAAYPGLLRQRESGYTDLSNRYGVTPQDEVSALPFLDHLRQQKYGNQLPGSIEDALNYAANKEVMSGTQYGSGFRPAERPNAALTAPGGVGPPIPTVPYGRMQRVLSLQTGALPPGQMSVDKAVPATLKSATLDAMREYYLTNHGPQAAADFDTARANFRHYSRNVLPQFEEIAGKYTGTPGVFENAPAHVTTASQLLTGRTGKGSENVYGPFADRIDPHYQGLIAANYIDMMGRRGGEITGGQFRPEKLSTDLRGAQANMPTLLANEPTPPPGVLSSMDRLRHVENLGRHFDVPQSAGGLTQQIGAGAALHAALGYLTHLAGGGVPGVAATVAAPYSIAKSLVSPSFKRALGGASSWPDIVDALRAGVRPTAQSAMQDTYRTGGSF